ncbi:MAG: ABC transporter ATP-binding protein [Pseudomonadota bacterium]
MPAIVIGARLHWIVLLVAIGLVQTATLLGTAWMTQVILEPAVSGDGVIRQSGVVALIVLAAVGVSCRWAERMTAERLGNHYVHTVRLALYDAVIRLSQAGNRRSGIDLVRFTGDLTATRQWVAMGIARSISAGLFLAGVVLSLYILYAPVGQYTFLILFCALAIVFAIGIGIERSVKRARRQRGRLANLVTDILSQAREIAAFGRISRERRRLARHSTSLHHNLQVRAHWLGGLTAFTDLVHRVIMILVIVGGAQAMLNEQLSVATLLTLCGVAALLGGPLRELGRVYEYRKNFCISRSKIASVLANTTKKRSAKRLREGSGVLTLKSVALKSGDVPANLIVKAGQRVALLGSNGAGKSRLLNAIAGLEAVYQGRILLDNVDTDLLRPSDRSRSIGIAAHRSALATGSISKNVRYRQPRASMDSVRMAVRTAGLETVIRSQPAGLSTRLVGPAGGISEGEAARIKLARAVLGEPRLLLLDEIEAGLDSEGRQALGDLLNEYPGTIVFATHDDALAGMADHQWHLHERAIRSTPTTATTHYEEAQA